MKKTRTKFCDKKKQKSTVKKAVLNSLTNKTFVNTYNKLMDSLTAQFATKLEVSSSLPSKQKYAKYDSTTTNEIGEQVVSNFLNTVQNNTVSVQFPSTSKVSSSGKSKSPKHHSTTNSISVKNKGNNNKNAQTLNEWITQNLVTSSVNTHDAKYDRTTTNEIGEQVVSSSSNTVQNDTVSAQFPSTSKVSSSGKPKSPKHHNTTNSISVKNKGNINKNAQTLNEWITQNLVTGSVNPHDVRKKNKRRTKAHERVEENVSNTNNTPIEHNCNGRKIVKNNANKTINKNNKEKPNGFSDHIPVSEMQKILNNQTSDNIQYVKGNLRINSTPYKYAGHAYLRMENENERDLLIIGSYNRNRAFHGDLVVACIRPEKTWIKYPDGNVQKTGRIVCILEKVHPRKAVGYLRRKDSFVLLEPKDQKIPMIIVQSKSLPSSYFIQPNRYENSLFLASIDSWEEEKYASGSILLEVGKAGEIEAELQTIILENNLDVSPYEEELLKGLPGSHYVLTDSDLRDREDWRHECILTIDPPTAADIDDAVSCKVLDNGNYQIGVHISDVTHYLEFFSPLDVEVSKRATTIYMPHKAYHMLPKELNQLCSLAPGKDKLTFSVIWEITPDAEIVKHRFAKTVIRSCCQLSYESAQAMIDNPEKSWPKDFLDVKGDYTISTLSDVVNKLFKLSVQLRKKRFINGALRLDQPKIQICIDAELSLQQGFPVPTNYYLDDRKDSNSLIEEFMLLANITVATHLQTAIPETALLRIHRDPNMRNLNTVVDTLQKFGIHLDIQTAGTLQTSIHRYDPGYNPSALNDRMKFIMMVIIHMCSKTMIRAEYICTSGIVPSDLKHYALNVPFYTHFTSPIRRYPDCIVHRLLYATIMDKPLPKEWTVELCSKIALNCNMKKYNAKLAQEQSIEMFFAYMVGCAGGFEDSAIVTYIKEDSIEVMLCETGIKFRLDLKEIEDTATIVYSIDYHVPTLTINWKKPSEVQVINVFSLVRVRVEKISEELRLKATFLRPAVAIE